MTEDAPGKLDGMAAIQRADDVTPVARLAAAMLWSAVRDARDSGVHGHHARRWLVRYGPDWLAIILDIDDPGAALADLLDGEAWFDREAQAMLDGWHHRVAR